MIRGKLHIEKQMPFMSKSQRDLQTIWPKGSDVTSFIKSQKRALRKATTPEQRYKIKLIIDEFESIKELL